MFVRKHFAYLNFAFLKIQSMNDIIMRNLRGTIFNMKINVLEDFYICISVLLIYLCIFTGANPALLLKNKFL